VRSMSTPCVYLVEGKAERERRWPAPSYSGPRNVRVLTLHDPTTIRLWEYLYLFYINYSRIRSHQMNRLTGLYIVLTSKRNALFIKQVRTH